jgi:hypothetical protein
MAVTTRINLNLMFKGSGPNIASEANKLEIFTENLISNMASVYSKQVNVTHSGNLLTISIEIKGSPLGISGEGHRVEKDIIEYMKADRYYVTAISMTEVIINE